MREEQETLRSLLDELSSDDVARVMEYARQVREEADNARRNTKQPRCWSCNRPRDYASRPLCPHCLAPDRRQRL